MERHAGPDLGRLLRWRLRVPLAKVTDSRLTDPATGKEIRLTSYAACAG
jgi:hypothetical protein